jgi:transcriptional regulator with XRE-family HTH domain
MDIAHIVRDNLRRWMEPPSLMTTVVEVARRSGVPRESVRRAYNGEGNSTIKTIDGIATAFGKTAADLVSVSSDQSSPHGVQDASNGQVYFVGRRETRMQTINAILERTDDDGLIAAIERLEDIAIKYPRARPQKGAM